MANITRTFGTPTDLNKWTWSAWVKKSNPAMGSGAMSIFSGNVTTSEYTGVRLQPASGNDVISFHNVEAGSYTGRLLTNRVFRDPGAWYHMVFVWDSDNATPGDRMIIYINGVRETSFAIDINPGSGDLCSMASGDECNIGGGNGDASYLWEGCMSHVQFVDGSALAPTEFGEFDSTSGIWKIKTGAYATPGNNGFFLKMVLGKIVEFLQVELQEQVLLV